jgi:N-acetylglucosaminyl-diphospho-decaprenol L-rhamnosyltransferase
MISIVIVNWNSGPLLQSCVQSLLRNAEGCQIIIADNGSTDGSLLQELEDCANILLIRNERNLGFAGASNLGWQASKGEFVLFLNPDTECRPKSIHYLQETFTDDSVWAAGGLLVSPSGKAQASFNVRRFPSIKGVLSNTFFFDRLGQITLKLRQSRPETIDGAIDVDQPAAACLMVSRAALERIGGFDESFYPAWFEDVDLCRRIRNCGGRIRFQPKASFLHHGGHSLENMSRQQFLSFFHTNQIRYFKKHHGTRTASHVKKLILFGLWLRGAVSILYPLVPRASRLESAGAFWKTARQIMGAP